MFLLSFTLFIIIFLLLPNFLAIVFLGLFIIFFSILFFKKKRKFKQFSRNSLLVFLAFFTAFISISVKQFRYISQIPVLNSNSTDRALSEKSQPQGSIFVGSGLISDLHSEGKYIFTDSFDREYFFYSEKKYEIGDEIRTSSYFLPGLTGSSVIYNLKSFSIQELLNFKFHFLGDREYQFDYNKWLMMKGFYGTLYEKNSVILQSDYQQSFISKTRKNLQNLVIQTYGENKISGLVLGMLIGDRSQLPKEDYQTFIDSGLVHIIAVSGGNIVMIVVFLGFVLFRVPFYPRNAIILTIVISYAFLCGLDSSVFRAMIMGGMSLLALFRGREVNIWRSLSIAFVSMLIINPYFLIYDIGFLLSFSAIIGLILLDGRQKKKLEHQKQDSITPTVSPQKTLKSKLKKQLDNFLKAYISPTIGATLGVFPVMAFFIGKINLVGLFANALVLPIVPFVMIYGFVSVFLYKIFPFDFLILIEEVLVKYIFFISQLVAKFGLYISIEAMRLKRLFLCVSVVAFVVWRLKKSILNQKK